MGIHGCQLEVTIAGAAVVNDHPPGKIAPMHCHDHALFSHGIHTS